MAGQNVDTEALMQAARALGAYISEVNSNILKMSDAALDCSDNMGSDKLSEQAIEQLNTSIKDLRKAMADAEALKARLLRQAKIIEEQNL